MKKKLKPWGPIKFIPWGGLLVYPCIYLKSS